MDNGSWDDDSQDDNGWRQPHRGEVGRRLPGEDEPDWPRGDEHRTARRPDRPAAPSRGERPSHAQPAWPEDSARHPAGRPPRGGRASARPVDAAETEPIGVSATSAATRPDNGAEDRVGDQPGKRRGRRWPLVTGYAVLGMVSLLVLGVTGFAWATYTEANSKVHRSNAIHDSGVKTSLNGDTNILIMGLDTRLDENGNPLPQNIYDALHAGGSSDGGENANVLMLLHVPANGPATEISIPRDDYVDLPGKPDGVSKEKIKEAYGLAFDQENRLLVKQGVRGVELEQRSRDAGREEEMQTVSAFLGGIPIDHFIEVTLVAFFEIAEVVAPIPVCIKYPTSDDYSGANFQAGQQELNAAQALAFVRQRRDVGVASLGRIKDYYTEHHLNFTDLDRERRQQALIASLAYKLKQAGTFTSPSRMSQILNVAEANIAVDSGFDLLKFASEASDLTSGNVSFHTLPIASYADLPVAGDVNIVNLPTIRADVQSLIGGGSGKPSGTTSSMPPTTTSNTPPPSGTIDVYNASGVNHQAEMVENALSGKGFTKGTTGTDAVRSSSVVEYGTDSSAAKAVANALGGLTVEHDSAIPSGHVRVILGKDFSMQAGLGSGGSSSTPTDIGPLPSQPPPANNGNNDADTDPMSSISGGGIPCVK